MNEYSLHIADIIIIAAYLVFTFLLGLYFSKRASRSMDDFFVSGRSLPWWIVGTSMVATTFAADTPLVVSGLVAKGGVWKNWLWWNTGIGGIVALFLFARLWNRAGITTDAELIELRYDGKEATFLRAYRAVWFGIFQNLLIIAWVMKAMAKITVTIMGWEDGTLILGMQAETLAVLVLFCLTVFYTVLSGFWGVVATDFVQFIIAMAGSIYLAAVSVKTLGGMGSVKEKIAAGGWDAERVFDIIPSVMPVFETNDFTSFLALVLVVWAVMYNIDGGGYLAQRLFAARNERHSFLVYLWYDVALICVRPWPWIVVGLCGMAFFGMVDDPETYYPLMMRKMLPAGVFGVMVASFLAAFMSTIDTQLNWGSSIIVNDIYKRFFRKNASQKELVAAGRISIAVLALFGAFLSFAVKDISQAWVIVFSVTAGIGTVYVLRWYWWRINAWSEIAAFTAAIISKFYFSYLSGKYPENALLSFPFSVVISTVFFVVPVWVAVTFITRPVGRETLLSFYRKVRPGGPGWRSISTEVLGKYESGPGKREAAGIITGIAALNLTLTGTGTLILGSSLSGIILLVGAGFSGFIFFRIINEKY